MKQVQVQEAGLDVNLTQDAGMSGDMDATEENG